MGFLIVLAGRGLLPRVTGLTAPIASCAIGLAQLLLEPVLKQGDDQVTDLAQDPLQGCLQQPLDLRGDTEASGLLHVSTSGSEVMSAK
jgi:hypothetical protein